MKKILIATLFILSILPAIGQDTTKANDAKWQGFKVSKPDSKNFNEWCAKPLPESKLHLPSRGIDGNDALMEELRKSEIN